MDIKTLKEIINSDLPDNFKEDLIIESLSQDESAIPVILKILNKERIAKKELILDMNLELSRAHIYIESRPESKRDIKQSFNKEFILDEIGKFYAKYKSIVSHCFNRFN